MCQSRQHSPRLSIPPNLLSFDFCPVYVGRITARAGVDTLRSTGARKIEPQDTKFLEQPTTRSLACWVLCLLSGIHLTAGAAELRCSEIVENASTAMKRSWIQRGNTSVKITLPPSEGRDVLIRTEERGVDVELQFQRPQHAAASSDSPFERAAVQYAYFTAADAPSEMIVKAKEPGAVQGTVSLVISSLPSTAENPSSVLGRCTRALKSWANADMTYAAGRAISLGNSPDTRATARDTFKTAVHYYEMTLENLKNQPGNDDRAALNLSLAAISYYELQDWAGAADWAEQAAKLFAKAGNPYLRARARAILAAAWMELATRSSAPQQIARTPTDARAKLDAARGLLATLAAFHARRHESHDEALQINNIGLAYYYEARFERGIPYFLKSKALFERLGEDSRAALALQNLALCTWGLGRMSAALTMFDQALKLMSPTLYPDLYLLTLNNNGLAHYAAGRFDESLRLQNAALDFATRSQADRARARSFYGMGVTYYAIGDRELALRFLLHALEICTPDLDARIRVATLRALAVIEDETSRRQDAISHNSEALRLATAPSARARILLQLAREYEGVSKRPEALQILGSLIEEPPNGDRLIRGMALVRRGAIDRESGQLTAAEADLLQGIGLLTQFDAVAEKFDAEVEFAKLRADQHRPADALSEIRRALTLSREIRAQTANPEYRVSIVRSLRPALEFELNLLRERYEQLLREGNLGGARDLALQSLRVVDDSRAQGFEDWRAEHFDSPDNKSVQDLLARSVALYQEIAERRFQLSAREDRAGADDPRARILRDDIARLRSRVGVINAELAAKSTDSPRGHPGEKSSLELFRFDGLPQQSAVVEYWFGSTTTYAWVVTNSQAAWISLGPSNAIDQTARELHEAMRAFARVPAKVRREAAARLYQLVFAPIQASIGSSRDLVVIPDGPLHYVPFAALRNESAGGFTYVVERYSISVAPAARLLTSASGKSPISARSTSRSQVESASRILIVADPVYSSDDPRLPNAVAGRGGEKERPPDLFTVRQGLGPLNDSSLERLNSTAREAAQIRSLFRPADVDLLQGLDATRAQFLAKDLSSYRFIHVASHGYIDSEIPQLSALILGAYDANGPAEDTYVRASDLVVRTFNAQVVVLSACDTGLGREFPSEGIIGLRYVALARGSRAVVASLWPVSDVIAADLMTYLYQAMIPNIRAEAGNGSQSSATVTAALVSAMRRVLQTSPELDPALWAPFTVYVAGN